jgi:SRSO17 transposase
LNRRSSAQGCHARARGGHLRHQAPARAGDDRAGHRGRGAVRLGGSRQHLRGWRDRDGLAPSRQGLRAGRERHPHFNAWIGKPAVAGTAEAIAADLDPSAWQRLSAGTGTKGERLYDWAYCELADLEPGEDGATWTGLWTRGLLIRRSLADGELAFFSTWCPTGTGIATLVAVEGRRWAIEDAFETTKTELGLAHNETRSWHGWHRHVSLVMLAFAMMAAVRHRANSLPPPKRARRARQAAA